MKQINQYFKWIPLILFLGIAVASCATKPFININYRLLSTSESLEGTSVFLTFKDIRTDKTTYSDKARKEFKQFTGKFSLSLTRENEGIVDLGTFDLPGLFKEAFSKRMENLGIKVISEQGKQVAVFEITLKSFFLDLEGGKWVTNINYEARLIKNGKILAWQNTSGNAERAKLFGTRNADKVLGELFTDMINEPDIVKLFQESALQQNKKRGF
ncbi:hypothetical protein ACFL6B_03550 [Thermodesulfobacteriota bacterium]